MPSANKHYVNLAFVQVRPFWPLHNVAFSSVTASVSPPHGAQLRHPAIRATRPTFGACAGLARGLTATVPTPIRRRNSPVIGQGRGIALFGFRSVAGCLSSCSSKSLQGYSPRRYTPGPKGPRAPRGGVRTSAPPSVLSRPPADKKGLPLPPKRDHTVRLFAVAIVNKS